MVLFQVAEVLQSEMNKWQDVQDFIFFFLEQRQVNFRENLDNFSFEQSCFKTFSGSCDQQILIFQ